MLTSIAQELQGLTTNALVILLLAMISPNMPTFRSVVAMVAKFVTLTILIQNTLLGEIIISSTRTTRVNANIIPLFPSFFWYISTCQVSSSLILWLLRYASSKEEEEEEEEEEEGKHGKNEKVTFSCILHILQQKMSNFCILLIFDMFFAKISLKVKST